MLTYMASHANRATYLPENVPYAAGLTTRPELEISEAIQACASGCLTEADPLACTRAYTTKLVTEGWSELDARQVEIGAMRVIANLLGNDSFYPEPY